MTTCVRDRQCARPVTRRGMCNAHYNQYRERQRAYGRWESRLVEAEPSRQHVKALQATGMGTRRIAELAGTRRQTINGLLKGRPERGAGPYRNINRDTATRILAVPIPKAHELANDRQLVDATGTVRRMQALSAIGYTQAFLSESIGVLPTNGCRLFDLRRQPLVLAATARRVEALYDRLQLTHGPSDQARRRAQRKGWAVPLAWDEASIDNPNTQPDNGIAQPVGFLDRYIELKELGESDMSIAARMGIQLGSLVRQLGRHDIPISAELAALAYQERQHRKAS